MGRQARATPEELARACKKLQADDNLTIHTLRHELGGGGAEYLTRGLREWRQQQREEARGPMEQMVSGAMRTALADEMLRVRDEAAQEVHSIYADDRAHLDFCLSEIRRLEREAEQLEATVTTLETEDRRVRAEKANEAAELKGQVLEQSQRADRLSARFDELQRQERTLAAELAVARDQRGLAERKHEREQELLVEERKHASCLAAEHADVKAKFAAMKERCDQQQETLRYMREDLKAKAHASEKLGESLSLAIRDAQTFAQAAARAESALAAYRHGTRHLILRRLNKVEMERAKRPDA